MKKNKKKGNAFDKFLDFKKGILDFKKRNSDLKIEDINQNTEVLDRETEKLSKEQENANKKGILAFIKSKNKISAKQVRRDKNTGYLCVIFGILSSIASCAMSIIGMLARFPDGKASLCLGFLFLFLGIVSFVSNVITSRFKSRFNQNMMNIKVLGKELHITYSICTFLDVFTISYIALSIMSNYMLFDVLIADNTMFGKILKVLFSMAYDLVAFSFAKLSDKFLNLDYNEKTKNELLGKSEQFAYFSDEKNGTENKVQDDTKISTGDEKSVPILENENGTNEDEKLVQYENEKADEIKHCTNFFGTEIENKTVQNEIESVPKKNESCTKNNRTKNEQIASKLVQDCKHNLADFEDKNFSKKIFFECLTDKAKRNLNFKTKDDISKRVFDIAKELLIKNGFLIQDENTKRYKISIDYDKASKAEDILKEADLLKK